jgi:hypothetical protein
VLRTVRTALPGGDYLCCHFTDGNKWAEGAHAPVQGDTPRKQSGDLGCSWMGVRVVALTDVIEDEWLAPGYRSTT